MLHNTCAIWLMINAENQKFSYEIGNKKVEK